MKRGFIVDYQRMVAVKKKGKYLAEYQNQKAKWCNSPDRAWMTRERDIAEGFANLTGGKVVAVEIIVREVWNVDKKEGS